MKTCQFDLLAALKNRNLCSPLSHTDSEITQRLFGISVLHPQTAIVSAIDGKK